LTNSQEKFLFAMHIFDGTRHSRLKKFVLGAHPVIQYYLDKLRIREIFRTYVKSDARQLMPTEEGVCILLHNILTSPLPLYQIGEWMASRDAESLGLGTDDATILNDDRLGRVLDAVARSNRKTIFFRIALRMIKLFELDCRHVHQDTTTVKFCGRYETWVSNPMAAHGYSKDHRPDLKQLVLGINVVGDGAVPIAKEVYSGNRTDDSVHISNWDNLRRLLQTSDFIYTADSKLCTEANLSHIEFYGGQYITVMPRTWQEDQSFRQLAREDKVNWQLILERQNNRHPNTEIDQYYTTSTDYQTDSGRRIVWIKSTQKAELDQQMRVNQINETLAALKLLNTKLNKRQLKRLPEIQRAVKDIFSAHETMNFISYSIHKRVVVTKSFLKRGRPTTKTPIKTHRRVEYQLAWDINQEEVIKQRRVDGVFPLLTNNKVKSAREVLEIYKYQAFLENRHSQLKTYLEVAPVYLKNPNRVLALLDLIILSLCIATLMERDLRNGMKRNGLKSIPIYPEERDCKYPTAHSIIRVFQEVEKFEVLDREGEVTEYFPPRLTPLQKQILNLMEVPLTLYA
jgi:transposase